MTIETYVSPNWQHEIGYCDGRKRLGRRPDWRIAADRQTPTTDEMAAYEAGFKAGLASVGG